MLTEFGRVLMFFLIGGAFVAIGLLTAWLSASLPVRIPARMPRMNAVKPLSAIPASASISVST